MSLALHVRLIVGFPVSRDDFHDADDKPTAVPCRPTFAPPAARYLRTKTTGDPTPWPTSSCGSSIKAIQTWM